MAKQGALFPVFPVCATAAVTGQRQVGQLGFNGQFCDQVTGHYLLGNGYRAFNPVLMRFNSPDSLSPFAEGGINAYAYCLGDPANCVDPGGHWPAFLARAGLRTLSGVTFTAGIATGLTAGLIEAVAPNSDVAKVMGGVAVGLIITGGLGLLTTRPARIPAAPVPLPAFDPAPAYAGLKKVILPPRLSVDVQPPPAYSTVMRIRRASV